PDNVLLAGRHALVSDFGIAKALSSSGRGAPILTTGAALGTAAYMAPEQIAGVEEIDHRADIYAVGALGYELLTGRPPFTDGTRQAILAAHLREAPAPLAAGCPTAPAPIVELVRRRLEKRPADRWQSADEMVQRLEALAVSRPMADGWRNRWSRMRIERFTDFP